MHIDFPYLTEERDRHGNIRLYVRRHRRGGRVRIKEKRGTAEFAVAYTAALAELEDGKVSSRRSAPEGTFAWLAASDFASQRFQKLDKRSQATRRLVIEECLREPPRPGVKATMALCPITQINASAVMMLMERKGDHPGAANNRKKYLSALFGWAVSRRLMTANPARDAERVQYASEGFHPWSIEEVRQYEERHPIGTKARLALALLLFAGARKGDVVTLGRQHVKNGVLTYVPRKTRYKRMEPSKKPWLPELAQIVAKSPTGDLTFLVTDYGKPFTAAGFGAWFRKRCDEAGLPHCTAHGLRKAGATLAAEGGATDRELMAMFDWTTASQATVYTRAADKKRLAAKTAQIMVGRFGEGHSSDDMSLTEKKEVENQ
jgi:integrase